MSSPVQGESARRAEPRHTGLARRSFVAMVNALAHGSAGGILPRIASHCTALAI